MKEQSLFYFCVSALSGKVICWLSLDDEQLLRKAVLYRRGPQTGLEGYTLAAALLVGQDEVMLSVLPHYKIDALLRRQNLDRYGNRLYGQTISGGDGRLAMLPA